MEDTEAVLNVTLQVTLSQIIDMVKGFLMKICRNLIFCFFPYWELMSYAQLCVDLCYAVHGNG